MLQISREASADEIKKSFHRLAFLYHPDRNGGGVSEELFKEINEAYQCLSDPQKKQKYDVGNVWIKFYNESPEPYLHAEISTNHVKLNEEFEITYRYIGEGRFLNKPSANNFVFTSGPIVNHQTILFENTEVRETALSYTVSAKETGTIIIDPAIIEVKHKHILSNQLSIDVERTECYFKPGINAGDQPFVVRLHKEQLSSNSVYRKTYTFRHLILVPRSDYVAFYHRIGSIMKIVFAVCGFCFFIVKGQHPLLGMVTGSLIGGVACYMMYWMSGVKSKYFYGYKHPLVLKYLERNYQLGNDPANLFVRDSVIQRLVMLFK